MSTVARVTNDWFPVLTGFLGTGVGAVIGLGQIWITERGKQKKDDEAWRRDRRADVLAEAVLPIARVVSPAHPEYDAWRRSMAHSHFLIGLCCQPDTAKAYRMVTDGFGVPWVFRTVGRSLPV